MGKPKVRSLILLLWLTILPWREGLVMHCCWWILEEYHLWRHHLLLSQQHENYYCLLSSIPCDFSCTPFPSVLSLHIFLWSLRFHGKFAANSRMFAIKFNIFSWQYCQRDFVGHTTSASRALHFVQQSNFAKWSVLDWDMISDVKTNDAMIWIVTLPVFDANMQSSKTCNTQSKQSSNQKENSHGPTSIKSKNCLCVDAVYRVNYGVQVKIFY